MTRPSVFQYAFYVALITISGCGSDTVQFSYDTYALFAGSKSQKGGWVPEWLPESATKIIEKHNLDTNARMWSSSVPLGTEVKLPAVCASAKRAELPSPPFEAHWWPESMAQSGPNSGQGFFYFKCGNEYVGFAQEGGKFMGWSEK